MTQTLPNPFISALTAEALPAAGSGTSHHAAGSVDYDALFEDITLPDHPPIFLRNPSQAFMRALFELSR